MTTLLTMLEIVLEKFASDEGNCFLTRAELHDRFNQLIDTAIVVGGKNGRLVVRRELQFQNLPGDRIYLPRLEAAERACAGSLQRMRGGRM